MKIVITGGSGFLGTNLAKYLAQTEPESEVTLLDLIPPPIPLHKSHKYQYGDVRNLKNLLDAFDGADEVYHLAGILGTSELLSISSLAAEVNIVGVCNMLDACRIKGVKRIYNVAKPHFEGYDENTYTLTKHAGELFGLMYKKKYGMSVATVRWLNAVGPYQHLYPVRKFVPTMILFAMFNHDLEVYGSGNQTIDPIDVVDLSRFTVYACRNLGQHADVVDLGSGVAINCNDAAEMILHIVRDTFNECTSKLVHIPMREGEGDDINLKADVTYWESVGMRTEVSFEESIRKTFDYMRGLPTPYLLNALKFYGKEPA